MSLPLPSAEQRALLYKMKEEADQRKAREDAEAATAKLNAARQAEIDAAHHRAVELILKIPTWIEQEVADGKRQLEVMIVDCYTIEHSCPQVNWEQKDVLAADEIIAHYSTETEYKFEKCILNRDYESSRVTADGGQGDPFRVTRRVPGIRVTWS